MEVSNQDLCLFEWREVCWFLKEELRLRPTIEDGQIEELKALQDSNVWLLVARCLFLVCVIPSRFWRLVVFHSCIVICFLCDNEVGLMTHKVVCDNEVGLITHKVVFFVVPTGEARLLVTVGLKV